MTTNICCTEYDCRNKYLIVSIPLLVFILTTLFCAQNSLAQGTSPTYQDYIQPDSPENRSYRDMNYTQEKKVHIIYLVPFDSTENPAYTLSLENAARHLQLWYRDQLGENRTFGLSDPVVEVYKTPHTGTWYSTNPNGSLFVQFWNNVLYDGFKLTGGRFYDPNNIWIFYIDALNACGQCGGCGGGGVAVISANDLRGLTGLPWIPICPGEGRKYTPCRYIGGLGHELGHAFGVPHPPGCEPYTNECDDNSIMWTGYTIYPYCYFSENEKNILTNSPFIAPRNICGCEFSCTDLLKKYYYKISRKRYYCYGDSVFLGGGYQKKPGIYYDSLLTEYGCDSIIETQLIVAHRYGVYTERTICDGEEILICDTYRNEPGIYIDSFKTIHGCDSIHYTTLLVDPSYHENNRYEICKGDTLYIRQKAVCQPGTYYDSLITIKGCDSIVISEVIVHPAYKDRYEHEICENDSIYLVGKYRSASGLYTDSLSSFYGCDSIAIHSLRVQPVYRSFLNYEICEGESMILGGERRMATGIYYDTILTEHACDHIIESDLIVHENPEIDLGKDTLITTLDTLILDAGMGYLTYEWNNGTSRQILEVFNSEPDDYEIIVEVTDFNYCKNSDTIVVTVVSGTRTIALADNEILIYPNPSNEYLYIQLSNSMQLNENLKIRLLDMFGRECLIKITDNPDKNSIFLNISDLKRGIYILCIEEYNKIYTFKIIIAEY